MSTPTTSSPPPSRDRRRRRVWRWTAVVLGGLGLAVIVAAATVPWWLGGALRLAGGTVGVTFSHYERLGYARWALHDVQVDWTGGQLRVSRLEAPTPLRWLMAPPQAAVQLGELEVTLQAAATPVADDARQVIGWSSLHDQLTVLSVGLRSVLPSLSAETLVVEREGRRLVAHDVRWSEGVWRVGALRSPLGEGALEFTPPSGEDAPLQLTATQGEWRFTAEATRAHASGTFGWRGQTAPWTADWATDRWAPTTAEARAEAWLFPATLLGLPVAYDALRGAGELSWRDERLRVSGALAAEARDDLPAVTARFAGEGSPQRLAIHELSADAPGLSATLAAPFEITWQNGWQVSPSELRVEADLARWTGWETQGTLRGRVRVTDVRQLEFSLQGEDLRWRDTQVHTLALEGRLAGTQLDFPRAQLAADFGTLDARGAVDLAARTVTAELEGTLAASAAWPLPLADLAWQEGKLTATLSGPLADPAHRGTLTLAGLARAPLREVESAVITWEATALRTGTAEVQATAGEFALTARLAADGAAQTLEFAEFRLVEGPREIVGLGAPARVRWGDVLEVEVPELTGALAQGRVRWSGSRLQLTLREVDSTALDGLLVAPPVQGVAAQLLEAELAWTGSGAAMGRWRAQGELRATRAGRAWPFALSGQAGAEGLELERLRIGVEDAAVIAVRGRVPVVLTPGAGPRWRAVPAGTWDLDVRAQPTEEFWRELGEGIGATLIEPRIAAQVRGPWATPEFEINASVARVAWSESTAGWRPSIAEAVLNARGDAAGFEVKTLAARIAGQAVALSARWPVPPARWWAAVRAPAEADWTGLAGELAVERAEVAPLVEGLGGWIAPAGWFEARLARDASGATTGHLKLAGLATRPVFPWGALQEIAGTVYLDGRAVDLGGVSALAGGQPVRLSGVVADLGTAAPRFDLTLEAQRVPLVRQPGVSVRSDLKLHARTGEAGRTRLTGEVTLRDSLFLTDVRALLPSGGPRAPESRPPWFSVDRAPLGDWELDILVRGDRFLRVRTPVFRGTVSAEFRLGGTLRTPQALGEARVDEGDITLPFASFEVQQGTVALRPSDPYEPQLLLSGGARRFGYDLQLEVSGTAQRPRLAITSSPPLTSEQALLLVTAGVVPSDEDYYSSGDRLTRLGTFVGQSLLAGSGDSELASRLRISSGAKVSRQGRETYEVDFELSERWMLTGDYDEFDAYNAGLKWRVLSDAPPAAAEPKP